MDTHIIAQIGPPGAIFISIVAIALIGVAAYYITRMMKGKIEIHLPKTAYNSGEPIEGSIKVSFKKSLELNRLYVALIGTRITKHRDSDGDIDTDKDEIYRYESNVLEDQRIPAGFQQRIDFSVDTPEPEKEPTADELLTEKGKKIASIASKVLRFIPTSRSRLEWKVEARADLPGVDIATSKKVHVNTD